MHNPAYAPPRTCHARTTPLQGWGASREDSTWRAGWLPICPVCRASVVNQWYIPHTYTHTNTRRALNTCRPMNTGDGVRHLRHCYITHTPTPTPPTIKNRQVLSGVDRFAVPNLRTITPNACIKVGANTQYQIPNILATQVKPTRVHTTRRHVRTALPYSSMHLCTIHQPSAAQTHTRTPNTKYTCASWPLAL